MTEDIQILLPPDTRLNELRVVDAFDKYNDCLQRSVILLLLNPQQQFSINGLSLKEILRRGEAAAYEMLNTGLSTLADRLKYALNLDGDEVSDVTIAADLGSGREVKLHINITQTSGDVATGSLRIQ